MASWKKRWKQELDAAIPALDERVKNAAIEGAPQTFEPVKQSFFARSFSDRRRLFATLGACVCALLIVCSSLFFFLSPSTPTTVSAETILVEINPRAAFVVDEDGKVSDVRSMNEDGDVILGGGRLSEFKGKTAEQAIELYADYALRLGFINAADVGAIRVASYVQNGRLQAVQKKLEAYFQSKGVYVAVFGETVEKESFLSELGLKTSGKTVEEALSGLDLLYAARQAEGKTSEEIESLYRERISWENVKEDLDFFIRDGLNGYTHIWGDEFEEIFKGLTAENFETELLSLINFLDGLGVDVSSLRALIELPTTIEEYIEKTEQRIEDRYGRMMAKGEAAYKELRSEISATDYAQYLQKIESEYGSLAAYWTALKKNK